MDVNDLLAIRQGGKQYEPRTPDQRWRKKSLLFTGDAEQESWAIMKSKVLLGPLDVLKVHP